MTCSSYVQELRRAYLHALVLAHDAGQLQVTLDLLADLLEAVDDGHGGDGVDAAQDVQRHVDQTLRGETVSMWVLNQNNNGSLKKSKEGRIQSSPN